MKQTTVRLPADLHRDAKAQAAKERMSLEAWIAAAMRERLHQEGTINRVRRQIVELRPELESTASRAARERHLILGDVLDILDEEKDK